LLGLLVGVNVWWVHHYRFGLPFNIDESGYLQRAVAYQQSFHHFDISQIWHLWRQPDIVAPLLPIVGGLVGAVSPLSPWTLIDVQQVFYVVLVLSSYSLARALMSERLASLAALSVACTPGVLVSSHQFMLAEPAAALIALALAAQVRLGSFEHRGMVLLWGISLGLATLTRTMVVAMVVPLLFLGVWQAFRQHINRRTATNLIIGVTICLAISLSWYINTWHVVYHYLTQYGYGSQASQYTGGGATPLARRWLVRLRNLIDQDFYLPMGLAVLIMALGDGARTLSNRMIDRRQARSPSPTNWQIWVLGFAIIGMFVVLATSSNSGSYFELPLVAPVIVGAFSLLQRMTISWKLVFAVSASSAALLSALDQFGAIPALASASDVTIAGQSIVAFNAQRADFAGPVAKDLDIGGVWWSNCGGATVTCFYGRHNGITVSYLRSWITLNQTLESFLYRYSGHYGRTPVVFFAYQGPLFNTNSIGLQAQLDGRSLPIGALVPPPLKEGVSLHDQLQSPEYGQPNIVLAASPRALLNRLRNPDGRTPIAETQSVLILLRSEGFSLVKTFTIPNASPIGVWWTDR
jgi:4-amino-4-deoxy-L-arabinose transferase-like glycosyltransferase